TLFPYTTLFRSEAGAGGHVAVLDAERQVAVQQRVRLEQLVIGPLQAELLRLSVQDPQQAAEDPLLNPGWQGRAALGEDVGRHAEDVLGDDPVAAPHADHR